MHMLIFKNNKERRYGIFIYISQELMNIFLYILLFITGTFFGSFFTLAVYRIPKKEDILIKHSYCPNCKHKLGFFDLFPIFSYLFLKGKCRYCKTKIRPRYFILEILSGSCFVIVAWIMQFNIFSMTSMVDTIFTLLYISILFIIAGIDKENIKIEGKVLAVGFCFEVIYIIYQCVLQGINIYLYVIYAPWFFILLIGYKLILKSKKTYLFWSICLSIYMILFTNIFMYSVSVFFCCFIIGVLLLLRKDNNTEIPIGFYLSISHIGVMIIYNYLIHYCI